MPSGGRIPRSRAARGTAVARLAAEQAARHAGTRAANLARSPEAGRVMLERRQLETADQIVAILGTMKGAAMKIGQMLSVVDLGMVTEGARPEFQRRLAALRDAAPEVPFERMRERIERDLEAPLETHFAHFGPEPIGTASIGQVYRARMHDGRDVAVKVQYPGVATAVRADLKNLALFMRLFKRVAPGLDAEGLAQEIRERVIEELDYALEARNQQAAAELFAGHPFVVVPAVIGELCREHVLVTEFVDGQGFEAIKEADDATRDRVGEIVYRFYCGSLYRLAQFSGDPHPGNFLLLPDGRVAFLDFGLYKHMDRERVEFELACERAVVEGRAGDLRDLWAAGGVLSDPDAIEADRLLEYARDAVGWYVFDEEVELTSELATAAFISSADPRSPYFSKMRDQSLPPEHLIARRVELFTLGIVGQLRACANWHRIAREWMYGEPPATALGELEAEFYALRAPTN